MFVTQFQPDTARPSICWVEQCPANSERARLRTLLAFGLNLSNHISNPSAIWSISFEKRRLLPDASEFLLECNVVLGGTRRRLLSRKNTHTNNSSGNFNLGYILDNVFHEATIMLWRASLNVLGGSYTQDTLVIAFYLGARQLLFKLFYQSTCCYVRPIAIIDIGTYCSVGWSSRYFCKPSFPIRGGGPRNKQCIFL
jgi:hypothetical protein